jgi:itaconyl-CoA hydratase
MFSGELVRHGRGKTVTAFDGAGLAQLVLNSSDGHFNDDVMRDTDVGRSVVFGGLTLAIVVGLATLEAGRSVEELGLEDVRFRAPVVHGDTLYAYSQALGDVGGVVTLRHWGVNQRGEVVVELRRRVNIGDAGG